VTVFPESHLGVHLADPRTLRTLELTADGAGLMLGRNRQRHPVTARLFRPEHTRVLLAGDLRCAQLFAFRALALNAQIIIQSARPAAWEGFSRALGRVVAGGSVHFIPPGTPHRAVGTRIRPVLVVLDVGPAVGNLQQTEAAWQATLNVRDTLTAWDVDSLVRADLVVMQPLSRMEAALAASTLGLTEVQEWLWRIRGDMVTLVNRGTVRWAQLAPSSVERQVIGMPTRTS